MKDQDDYSENYEDDPYGGEFEEEENQDQFEYDPEEESPIVEQPY